jgi:uncharacterized SAM-binding protein YcdF (DUF218 family)
MFYFKKIVAPFLLPVPLCLEILILGVVLLLFTKRQKLGKAVVSIGTGLLLLFSFSPVSSYILASLEHSYPVLKGNEVRVKWIVVLGAGAFCDPDVPIGDRICEEGLYRLIEGVRLHQELPESKLIFTGKSTAPKMAEMAAGICGVPVNEIMTFPEPRDTEEESSAVKSIVKDDRLILVTSASHMPRAMVLFEKQGMHPLPAPAGFLVKKECADPFLPMPGPSALQQATVAFHEYLGLIWFKMRSLSHHLSFQYSPDMAHGSTP